LLGEFTDGSITESYAVGDVIAAGTTYNVGGLIGYMSAIVSATVTDCYARGDVAGVNQVGGLIGFIDGGTVSNTYAAGYVGAVSGGGGLIGKNNFNRGTILNSFWDTQTSGLGTSAGGTGKPTAEMKTQSTFTSVGWDFAAIWQIQGYVNDGYPFFQWWYEPADMILDINQVVHFQPNTIILGTTLPNRAGGGGVYPNGTFSWGDNPAGIEIRLDGFLQPEDVYRFEPIMPGGWDIIEPEPSTMTSDVDLGKLAKNPLRPLVQVLSEGAGFTERLAWLSLAIFILIAIMIAVQLRTDHMVFTALSGFAVAFLFYSIGVWGLWVPILLAFGLVASIVYERMPTL